MINGPAVSPMMSRIFHATVDSANPKSPEILPRQVLLLGLADISPSLLITVHKWEPGGTPDGPREK